MIFMFEKKTQQEWLNEQLRLSLLIAFWFKYENQLLNEEKIYNKRNKTSGRKKYL